MKFPFFSLLIFILSSYNAFTITLIGHKYEKVNGVQIFNLNFERNELDDFLKNVKNKGFNTVILRVFHNRQDRFHFGETSLCDSGVYFKSKKFCTVNDILSDFVKKAHNNNLKVYAWMATRSLSALKDIYGVDKTFLLNGTRRSGYGVNIFKEEVFLDIENLFKELAQYDIDGVLIQDDFILKYDESASDEAIKRFYVDTGMNLRNIDTNKMILDKFTTWKVKQLYYFLTKIIWDIKFVDPAIKVALNIYYETPLYSEKAKKWYAQSIEELVKSNVDYFAFMAYHKQIEDENSISFYETASLINSGVKYLVDHIMPKNRIIVKFQIKTFQDRQYIDLFDFRELCNIVTMYQDIGVIVLPVENKEDLKYSCSSFGS
jgi:biofilm PGA synthesis lipoprotein PgaB